MTGLRRHVPILGVALAWMIAFSALLGSLSLARTLPEAHANALAAASLCLPGGDGPVRDHRAHHAADCILCPGPGFSYPAAPLASPTIVAAPALLLSTVEFDAAPAAALVGAVAPGAQARGPPAA